jgi:ATP-binding protein involved in chromosome partitioning
LALADEGWRVGLLDADVHGPSVPMMMGVAVGPDAGRPKADPSGTRMLPIVAQGLQLMSAGFLTDEHSPLVWRGAAASGLVEQMLRHTAWDDLDYLLIDMPPGTGDIALTLCQRAPIDGAVVVTTPQDVALLDVARGVAMFRKADVPVLGTVENMAVHVCGQCGQASHPFGHGGGLRLQDSMGVPWLASMPLDRGTRLQADLGLPIVRSEPQGEMARRYKALARQLAEALATLAASRPDDCRGVTGPPGLTIAVSRHT